MKNLLIFGNVNINKEDLCNYNVIIYGQTKNCPDMTFLRQTEIVCDNYQQLVEKCKEIYCNYYGVTNDSIITSSHLNSF